MVSIFVLANLIVLLFCIWITVTDGISTGWWGTLGFSVIGVAAMGNVLKSVRMVTAIDMPETVMMVGVAIVCLWVMGRRAYWWKKEHKHG
ncbi:holin [Burkholderia metallica]|uniref:holin n=1 Tax=Burkholderia metallica TaxID=488729 RepID=UPI000841B9FA|nr:holin [Burkholderia metallica]AOJ31427.1 holin [Burkholderia metallica]